MKRSTEYEDTQANGYIGDFLRMCQVADGGLHRMARTLHRMICATWSRSRPDTPVTVSSCSAPENSTLLLPEEERSRQETAPQPSLWGNGGSCERSFAISTTFGFQLPIFLPSSIWEKCSSWSRCTQPPWSVNWIYGYQPYFSPFSVSQIQEYHATCERKHREGEMKTR